MKLQPFLATMAILFGAIFGMIASNQYLLSIQTTVTGDDSIFYRMVFFWVLCIVGFVWLVIITYIQENNDHKYDRYFQ